MKRFFVLGVILITLCSLISCGNSVPNTPEDVAIAAAKAWDSYDYETLRQLTDPEDTQTINTLTRWEKDWGDNKPSKKGEKNYTAGKINNMTDDGSWISVGVSDDDGRSITIQLVNKNGKWYYFDKN